MPYVIARTEPGETNAQTDDQLKEDIERAEIGLSGGLADQIPLITNGLPRGSPTKEMRSRGIDQ